MVPRVVALGDMASKLLVNKKVMSIKIKGTVIFFMTLAHITRYAITNSDVKIDINHKSVDLRYEPQKCLEIHAFSLIVW